MEVKSSKYGEVIVLIILCLSVCTTVLFGFIFSDILMGLREHNEGEVGDSWPVRLLFNLIGYACIFVPGWIIYHFVKRTSLLETGTSSMRYFISACFNGSKKYNALDGIGSLTEKSFLQKTAILSFCTFGILGSYLIWGLLQEKIMTQQYSNSASEHGRFGDSEFLVFVNRVLAFLLSGLLIMVIPQPAHGVPIYKYSFCSFSNVMSSWFQYEALKFISFPTQVLAKACKLIPVMLMGKLVSRRKYEFYEYVTAAFICVGMVMFLFGSSDVTESDDASTSISGLILICSYLAFDSFTSNWQKELFDSYPTTSLQMMCGVNFFSVWLTLVSLFQQGAFVESAAFMIQFPGFMWDCAVLSICSATGQLFVFYTINQFGPVVFIIIMTLRQGFAIILSCITYGHSINTLGVIGIVTVFFGVFLRSYCSQRLRTIRKRVQTSV